MINIEYRWVNVSDLSNPTNFDMEPDRDWENKHEYYFGYYETKEEALTALKECGSLGNDIELTLIEVYS
jgi:hypothetical protein